MDFITPFNFKLLAFHKEYNDEVSMTVPDMSYTVRDILEKYTRGVLPNIAKPVYYDEELGQTFEENEDLTRRPDFDYSDITEILVKTNDRQNEKKAKKLAKEEADRLQAEKEKANEEAVKATQAASKLPSESS